MKGYQVLYIISIFPWLFGFYLIYNMGYVPVQSQIITLTVGLICIGLSVTLDIIGYTMKRRS